VLWRTLSDEDGRFSWRGVIPGVPQNCTARVGEGAGASALFNLEPGQAKDIGEIKLDASDAESMLGKAAVRCSVR
jgi:hypothetical protein